MSALRRRRVRVGVVGLFVALLIAFGVNAYAGPRMWCATELGSCDGCYAEMDCDYCEVVEGGCGLNGWGCTSTYCQCDAGSHYECLIMQ